MLRSTTRSHASMVDVARHAGVSPQTVSRVSMGLPNVRPATREKVLAAMRELDYAPNGAARALKYGSFGVIGVIAHRLGRTGESRTVEEVVNAARTHGYTVMLVDIESPAAAGMSEALTRVTHQAIDGLVIIRAETATPDHLALPRNLPVVISDARFLGQHPAVGSDQDGGTRAAVEHLLSLGHATVHHLAGPHDSAPAQQRLQAWRAALTEAGREVPEPVVGDWTATSGYRAGQVLSADPRVTAVFCANDEMAAGLVHALHEAGRQVPTEVSVVGFDNIGLAAHLWPPLTTVDQDHGELGRQLVHVLLRQIRGEAVTTAHTLVPTRFVRRASTAPPVRGCHDTTIPARHAS